MADLVERYIHEVGRYLPQSERAEIEAELRSQIEDQLEDRYAGAPSQADVVAVLAEMGDPRRMAASYGSEQYLIGPTLYPVMMMVLRRGWVIVPTVVVLVRVLLALVLAEEGNVIELLLEAMFNVVQATFLFTAVVVLVFAIIQHTGVELDELEGKEGPFDPLALPEVDDPAAVDRFEAAFGVAFGVFATLINLYFLRVGGLTLRFNLNDPGDVIPVPMPWLILLIVACAAMVVLNLAALQRNRWSVGSWLAQTALELFSAVCFYFVVWQPLSAYFAAAAPPLANLPYYDRWPEIILVASILVTLASSVGKLVKMINHRAGAPTPYRVKTNG